MKTNEEIKDILLQIVEGEDIEISHIDQHGCGSETVYVEIAGELIEFPYKFECRVLSAYSLDNRANLLIAIEIPNLLRCQNEALIKHNNEIADETPIYPEVELCAPTKY